MRIEKINEIVHQLRPYPVVSFINKAKIEEVVEKLFLQLFPHCEILDAKKAEQELLYIYDTLAVNIIDQQTSGRIESILEQFFQKLPEIQKRLYEDAKAFLENDPAAKSLEEIILAYPGFFALSVHRMAHELYQLDVPIIPRLFSEYAHTRTGVDIHPGATIGNRFFLDHGTGIVIGETCIIGNNVKIYQGVTLGALHVSKSDANNKRHPTVEDNVVIYAGATILGGKTTIGHDSLVGGNVWLTESIMPYTTVYYASKKNINFKNKE